MGAKWRDDETGGERVLAKTRRHPTIRILRHAYAENPQVARVP
jgi:hypothetical protein